MSDSTIVKMPHCWKSHVAAHLTTFFKIVMQETPQTWRLSPEHNTFANGHLKIRISIIIAEGIIDKELMLNAIW